MMLATTSLVWHLVRAQEARRHAAEVTGTWTMTLEGGAHGEQTLQLQLEQKGSRVTGKLETPHGAHGVEGEFSEGKLELASSGNRDDDQQMTLSATLGEDGTLTGYLSTARGDMRFTARRTGDRG